MTVMQQAEQLLSDMSQAQKVQLLQMIARDLLIARDLGSEILGISKTPGVCGGAARIAGTRIPVWTLVEYRKLGSSEAELLSMYPTLRSEDLANAWLYFRTHQGEIEQEISENEMA